MADRYLSVSLADEPITVLYRFIKNVSWAFTVSNSGIENASFICLLSVVLPIKLLDLKLSDNYSASVCNVLS